jgi:hypothetical protein
MYTQVCMRPVLCAVGNWALVRWYLNRQAPNYRADFKNGAAAIPCLMWHTLQPAQCSQVAK